MIVFNKIKFSNLNKLVYIYRNKMTDSVLKLDYFPTKTFIHGKWVDSLSKKTFEVFDPATGKVLGCLADCDEKDAELAINSASDGFKIWSNFTADVIIIKNYFFLKI
jgi:hypothetical protein